MNFLFKLQKEEIIKIINDTVKCECAYFYKDNKKKDPSCMKCNNMQALITLCRVATTHSSIILNYMMVNKPADSSVFLDDVDHQYFKKTIEHYKKSRPNLVKMAESSESP